MPDLLRLFEPESWQNWIFTRPNDTGERVALTLYVQPERPSFNRDRTWNEHCPIGYAGAKP